MLFLCLNLFRGRDWWCSLFSWLFFFEVCISLLIFGFRVELVFSLCVSWFVIWILGCCSGGLVFLLFCLRHYCSYSLFLVLEFDWKCCWWALDLINVSVLCSVILFFVLDLFWGLDAVQRLLLCFRICYFFCSLVFVLKFSLFILMCGLNYWFYSLFFVLEFGCPDWKCYWCACRPLLMLLVFVPWCCLLCLNLCWGLDDVHPSLLCVFILLCGLNYWLLFWCLGFLFVLVRHYCSCSLFFVHPFHFFVLASPSIIWKRMCCGPSEKSDYNKSDEPFIDLTERVPCAWMRSQGHTQHVRQQPQGARCPTFHPHHTFTHNPHHLILKIYNKTTITPHGSFHTTS